MPDIAPDFIGKGGEEMSDTVNKKNVVAGKVFSTGIAVFVALGLMIGFVSVTGTDAYAMSASCGKDKYCGIKGKSFDAVYYSSGLSNL
jgi:hypothetical protein